MLEPRSTHWLLEQAATVGSTAAGIIASENKYQSPAELFDVMHSAKQGRIVAKDPNNDMRRGLMTEGLHRGLLQEQLGARVRDHDQNRFLYSSTYYWAHALPDGWVDYEGSMIPVQLKCPRSWNWQQLKLKGLHGSWLLGCMHSITVIDCDTEYFSMLDADQWELWHRPIRRDQGLIDQLMNLERDFWHAIENGARPPEQYWTSERLLRQINMDFHSDYLGNLFSTN